MSEPRPPRIAIVVLDALPLSDVGKLTTLACRAFNAAEHELVADTALAAKLGVAVAVRRIDAGPYVDAAPPVPSRLWLDDPCTAEGRGGYHEEYLPDIRRTGHNDNFCRQCGAHGRRDDTSNPLGLEPG
jgi:hypothetical protein